MTTARRPYGKGRTLAQPSLAHAHGFVQGPCREFQERGKTQLREEAMEQGQHHPSGRLRRRSRFRKLPPFSGVTGRSAVFAGAAALEADAGISSSEGSVDSGVGDAAGAAGAADW